MCVDGLAGGWVVEWVVRSSIKVAVVSICVIYMVHPPLENGVAACGLGARLLLYAQLYCWSTWWML